LDHDSTRLAKEMVELILEKRGRDPVVLDLREVSLIADYFILATGNSRTHVQALARYLEEFSDEQGVKLLRREGFQDARWILLDYGGVIVHLFQEETRQFYDLERLWGDAKKLKPRDLRSE